MKPLVLIVGVLIFGVVATAATCVTGFNEQVRYDGGREWLITTSIGSANGTDTHSFWGSSPDFASVWNKALEERVTEGRPDTKALVSLGVDKGEYELQFFDEAGNLTDSLTVQGGNKKTLEIDLPIGALRKGYGVSASDAKGVRYEIRLIFPTKIAEEQNRLGVDLAQQGRLEAAIAKFNEVIRLDPQFAPAYGNRGLAHRRLGQNERALEDHDEAIRLDPQLATAYLNRSAVYIGIGQYERALEDLDEAIRLDPQFATAYATRGGAYVGLDQYERALEDLDEAIRLDPQLAVAYLNRGAAYMGLGQFEQAVHDWDEMIRINPQLAAAYINRGAAYGKLGQYERAIEDLDEAIRLDPQLASAYSNRGAAYGELGQPQKAKADRGKACHLDEQYCLGRK